MSAAHVASAKAFAILAKRVVSVLDVVRVVDIVSFLLQI